jgi:hypothetical protein
VRIRLPRARSRAPLGIAGFIAIPLFFSSLMSATLALEKPRLAQWTSGGKLQTTWHDPSTATEARIWLWALLPPAVLALVGWVATRLPLGIYVPGVAAIVLAMAVVHKTAIWERHHTSRYPVGVDLIPPANVASDVFDRGQWEHIARDTALSLQHWTIGIAAASVAVLAALTIRRRYFTRKPVQAHAPLEGVHAPDATTPGLGG